MGSPEARDVVRVARAAEQIGELGLQILDRRPSIGRDREIDQARAAERLPARLRHALRGECEAAPGRFEGQPTREQDAVGDPPGEAQHLRSGRGDIDRKRRGRGEIHIGPVEAVGGGFAEDALAGPQLAQIRHHAANGGDRAHRLVPGFLEVEQVAHRNRDGDAPGRQLLQRGQSHRGRGRVPEIGADRGRHQAHRLGRNGDRRAGGHRLAIPHMLGDPDARGARRLGPPGEADHLARVVEAVEDDADLDRHSCPPARPAPVNA